jgi:hypothetical protein
VAKEQCWVLKGDGEVVMLQLVRFCCVGVWISSGFDMHWFLPNVTVA